MHIQLTGKRAVVSGSTKGIGYAIARGLAAAGAAVLINGRSEQTVAASVDKLKRDVPGAEVDGIAADLSRAEGVSWLLEHWPEADILVNNVGVFEPKPFFEITDEEWEYYMQLHVMAAMRLSRHYAKGMVERGWGRVLFNASVTGGFFSGEMVHYGTAKAALLGLSRGIAESVAGSGVTVNSFLPGPTRTERVETFFEGAAQTAGKTFEQLEQEMYAGSLPTSLVQRFIRPEEVASLVVFLASEQASAITGATMRADGGIVRSMV
ncbi:SDR family NAD(P)-dependent oxidoreductase [Paenibacillus cremeus]|uniref:SDR family oxidoreductase n=1 Tax=Paenibacillus cremeus TaxID=2163881 RepID=A0A559KH52_9BACL|nr:SDR family oxidoreductase [Paenibacillus cremeus]TVY11454.1 SDR family oxidoreductase [Paenibacillus cremeus]